MKKTLSWGLLLLAFLAFASLGHAQEITATISGVVSDASNAVVPNATVVIHSNATNLDIRTVTTESNGEYVAANLPAGTYTVTVKNPGFQTWISKNVVVNVAEKRTLDIQLSVGKVAETIEVSSSTQPVETTSSEQSQTITGTQVRELELNNRNFQQLVALQPGVSANWGDAPGFGINTTTTVAVNGARTTANNWTVDGADINDSGSNATLLNVPSIDAIQEFTLQRSNYDASSGRSGGGQILVATKSGTSDFHGSVYEFVRNDFFNANSYFSNATDTPRSIERYNDYGFTVGGPIWIPKKTHKSSAKTFFFWSEEWRKVSSPASNTFDNIPTAAELGGSFTGLAADPTPYLNNPACGTVTPVTSGTATTYNLQLNLATTGCASKNAQAYVSSIFSKYPANLNGTDFYYAYSELNNFRQDIIRVDQVINDKVRFYGRYMHDDAPENAPLGLWGSYTNFPGVASDSLDAPGRNVVGDLTWTITPRLTNEVEYVYTWGGINITEAGIIDSSAFTSQLTNNWTYPDTYGRGPNLGIGDTGLVAGVGNAPYFERNIDQSIIDNASYVIGPHALRFGFDMQFMEKTENATAGDASFNFSSIYVAGAQQNVQNTILPGLAQFLLGQNAGYSQVSKDTTPDLHYKNIEFYLQDDWKVTRRLTLNLGVRYSFFPTPIDLGNTLVNFDPNLFKSSLAPVIDPNYGTMVAGQGINASNYGNGLILPVGAACTAAQAIAPTATCSPYGSTINPNGKGNIAPRFGFAYDPFGKGKTAIRGGYGLFYDRTLNGIFEQNAFADPPLVQSSNVPAGPFDNILAGTPAGPSLGPAGLNATGSPAWHTPYYTAYNLSVQQEILPNTKLEVAYVGGLGTHLLGDVDLNQPLLATRLASDAATTAAESTDFVNVNALRPYAGFGRITSRNPEFTSNYNSLQITLNRQVSRGLNIGVAYTWSKNLTTNTDDRGSPANDTYDLKMDYGPSGYSTPQLLVFNYVYDLPWYRGQQGLVGHVLGGWEISGITTIQSGQPLTIYQNADPFSNYNSTLGAGDGGLGIYYPRADRTSTAISYPKTVSQWFNPSAFTDAVGHFGTSTNGQILGPGQQVWDIGFIKNISISERFRLQFRGEFFNAFNHANFNSVDSNVDDPSFGSLTNTHLPRNIQLALKLYF